MKRRDAGAGQVGLLWVVFLVVIILGLGGFTYIAFKEKAQVDEQLTLAKQEEMAAIDKYSSEREKMDNLSKVVGFREEIAGAHSSVEAISELITTIQENYPTHVAKDATTLQAVLGGVQAAHGDLTNKLTEAQQNFSNELELRRTTESNINTIENEKNQRISELEGQVNDEQQRAQAQSEEDNQRISGLQANLDEAESRLREAENRALTTKDRLETEVNMLNSRVTALSKKLEVLREPDLPDGRILNTVSGSALAYVDVGRRQGLRRGTKFHVFRVGKGGELLPKGWIEVRDVEADSALCGIIETIDSFDPIVKGDVIVNPTFVRNMQRTFVFLGEFPSSLNKGFVTERLQALGAKVTEKVSSDTDFLVLGDKEKGEFATELTDTPEYKLATQLGVQIMRLKDLAAYIEY